MGKDEASRIGKTASLTINDRCTNWTQSFASKHKDAEETKHGFKRFLGPQQLPEHVYTDGSKEFENACKDLGYLHDVSTPHAPETNGIIERANRRIIEGTSCALSQSGLTTEWWEEAQDCCFLWKLYRNLQIRKNSLRAPI